MRVLVTGGAGFIGSHLVRRLVGRGDEVVVVDSLEAQVHGAHERWTPEMEMPEGVFFLASDVAERRLVDRALDGVDQVVHLAAVVGVGQSMCEAERYVRRNTLATASFLEQVAAHRPRRLVVASSMSIYGEGRHACAAHGHLPVSPGQRPSERLDARDWECACPRCGQAMSPMATGEDAPLQPRSVYAITKRDQEELCLTIGAAYEIPAVALRFFNVYGPGQALGNPYTGATAIFANRILNGKPPVVFEDGLQTRDLVYVDDVVDAILLALDRDGAVGEAVNICTGVGTPIMRLAALIADQLDIRPGVEVGGYRAGDIRHCYGDPRKAQRLLGFTAKTPLEAGMRDLVSWLRRQGPAPDRLDGALRELKRRGLAQ